ncbi:MAG: hypothetical protein KDA80_18190 [Planctomycetaceae bacterium]|nr:hypothetical protein [Planctomycetaceae bacterium]
MFLAYHVFGLLIAPASVPPSSDLVRNSWLLVGPYLQLVNMNQGNHFFAPDPGSSTLIKYEANLKDGRKITGQIPDKNVQFPRLLYHRHFMLTEQFGRMGDYEPRSRALMASAFARQICQEHDAVSVDLTQVTHFLPDTQWIRAGYSLEEPELYLEQKVGHYEWNEF